MVSSRVQNILNKAYKMSKLRYDQRSRIFHATPGQEIYRRNFVLSNFSRSFKAKFARKFLRARVVKMVGNNAYLLENMQGQRLGDGCISRERYTGLNECHRKDQRVRSGTR